MIIRRINTNLAKKAGRSPEIIYYDVTNFYCEINEPDDDILDESGNVIEKELFMDDAGIPIAIESFPGNTLDHLPLRSALEKNIDGLEYSRFILIGDRRICFYPNLFHLKDAGNGYIVSKSLRKFFKKDCVNEKTCEILDSTKIKASIDFDKVEHWAQRAQDTGRP